jgi:FMN phosphatase YigB (HAD superfamily)
MIERAIKAVFFDWDFTLAYSKTPQDSREERLTIMFQLSGLSYTRDDINVALEQYDRDVEQGKVKKIDKPQTRREIASLYAYMLNFLEHKDNGWDIQERIYRSYALLPTFLFEDSRTTLQTLKERGYVLGILSNHARLARPVMEQLVGDLIPSRRMLISEELGVHKPAKTIFLRAAARVRTPPANCLLVGDNLEVDAFGSVQQGGFGHGVWLDRNNTYDGRSLPPSVSTINILSQLPDLLDNLLASPPLTK